METERTPPVASPESDGLQCFHPIVAEWFRSRVGVPSAPQKEAWPEIAAGHNVLVTAPTGSGKTLAAFLEAINQLFVEGLEGKLTDQIHVLYVSPLKALNNDIYRNLEWPLSEIREMCHTRQIPFPEIRKAVRTGDTPQSERQRMLRNPPHILITTPESLFLLLTSSKARTLLAHVRYLILDEVHALIDSKRGAHLSLSVERLVAACPKPPIRIGLTATVHPLQTAARFVGGMTPEGQPNPVTLVAPPLVKMKELRIEMPLLDFNDLAGGSVWPGMYDTVWRLIQAHTATIVFVNNRATAERIAANVNDLAGNECCIPHHGSLSKERRQSIEQRFKDGDIRCMVATATLELGIDVGLVDLMIQIAPPLSVTAGLQRLGRAGHRMDAVSRGRILPRTRGDLLKSLFIAREMEAARIEEVRLPNEPLDVLAQHLVSMACHARWTEKELMGILRRAPSYHALREEDLVKVLSMLAGDFEHQEDIPAKPRLSWDRIHGVVEGTPYSRMLSISAGGTIPDRGLFPVVLADGKTRIGELDEEYVFESRKGDVFMLGSTPWRMESIDRNRVVVTPSASAHGAETPFWKGDGLGMPFLQGQRMGAMLQEMENQLESGCLEELLHKEGLLDQPGVRSLVQYLMDQKEVTGKLPHDRRVVMETLADGEAGVSVILHAQFGGRVNATLEVLLRYALEEVLHLSVYTTHTDDLILLYLYGVPDEVPSLFPILSGMQIEKTLLRILPGTSRFAIAFRHNAYRSLMMGARSRGARLPLWVQRLRSVETMDRAVRIMDHPLVVETMRECMETAFDIPNTQAVLDDISNGRIELISIASWYPSPFAAEVLFRFEGELLYASAASHPGGVRKPVISGLDALHLSPRNLQRTALDPDAVAAVVTANDVWPKMCAVTETNTLHSLLMMHGDLVLPKAFEQPGEEEDRLRVLQMLQTLERDGRVEHTQVPVFRWIATEEGSLYRAAEPAAWKDHAKQEDTDGTWTRADAILRILRRFSRYQGPFLENELPARYAIEPEHIACCLRQLEEEGSLQRDQFPPKKGEAWCHRILLERMRHRAIQDRIDAVHRQPAATYATWLPHIQHVGASGRSDDILRTVLFQLEGVALPANLWEEMVFPARVPGWHSGLLDRVCSGGQVSWRVRQGEGGKGFLLSFHKEVSFPSEELDLEEDFPDDLSTEARTVLSLLTKRGASFTHQLTSWTGQPVTRLMQSFMELTEKGLVSNDTYHPIRLFLQWQKSKNPMAYTKRLAMMTSRMEMGRWQRIAASIPKEPDQVLEDWFVRWGMICREVAETEDSLSWADAYQRLKEWEYAGKARRGLFFEGLSGIQFLSGLQGPVTMKGWRVLNACDPALAYGRILPHSISPVPFTRLQGTVVVLENGVPCLTVDRNGKLTTVLDESGMREGIQVLADAFREKRIWPGERKLILSSSGPVTPESEKASDVSQWRELLKNCGFEEEVNRMVLRR